MTREKDDPEKRNLLNVHREDNKKRRQYSGSRNKMERRSCESSSSEHRKRSASYKISSTEQRPDIHNKSRSQTMPYTSEKKDSWWFWQNVAQKKEEDSCSCVSCALKKIVSSEYACVGCLLLLFTISIIVAFLVVFKNVPNIGGDCKQLDCKKCNDDKTTLGYASTCRQCKDCGVVDSERLKRKIDMLSSKRLKDGIMGLDEFQKNNKGYDDLLSAHAGIPAPPEIEFGPSFRELSSLEDSNRKMQFHDIDLSTILYSDKNMDPQSSEKLREFYKKLVQTDAKIKSLKKYNRADEAFINDHFHKSPERSRRSLKLYHYPKRFRTLRQRRSLFTKHQKGNERHGLDKTKSGNKTRLKRFGSESEEPTGFIIEKKKLLVQYKPVGKQRIPVKKCQHAPKESQTHEKEMMHPFYKNTQKLDELLDKFLNKNLPEIMSDPFGLDEFFKSDKVNKLCKHPKPHKNVNIIGTDTRIDQIPKPKFKVKPIKDEAINYNGRTTPAIYKMLKPESTTKYEREFFNHEMKMIGNEKKKLVTASPNDFEIMLSVSTIMNPDFSVSSKIPYPSLKAKVPKMDNNPKLRKLMQLEAGEDEEVLGYEDFKEVLTDDMDTHDEMEKPGDRRRRDSDATRASPSRFQNLNPPFARVQNPNWKCAMPLYPDEINSMMTNKDASKVELPKPTAEILNQRRGGDLTDIEYVEDYLAHKYDKLVQQAQAYSDYGVLDGKKESRNEKDSPTADSVTNHKAKYRANNYKVGLFGKYKRGRVPRVVSRKHGSTRRRQNEYDESVDDDLKMEINDVEVTTAAQTGVHANNYINEKSEGIRIELKPTTTTREDTENNADLMKIVSKHVKIKPFNKPSRTSRAQQVNTKPNESPFLGGGYIYNAKASNTSTESTTVFKNPDELDNDPNLLFTMTRAKRRLLATDGDIDDQISPGKGNNGSVKSNIDRFVQNLNLNSNSSTHEKSIKEYIENVKSMNVKIFSTPNTFNPEYSDPVSTDRTSTMAATKIEDSVDNLDSVVTINKSEVKYDNSLNNNFFGKILLTVKNPQYEEQKFKLLFDLPLAPTFKNEMLMVNENINVPYDNYQFQKFTEINPKVNDYNSFTDAGSNLMKNFITKRQKRIANLTATWVEIASTRVYNDKEDRFAESNITADPTPLSRGTSEQAVTPVSNSSYIALQPYVTPMPGNITSTGTSAFNSSSKSVRPVRSSSDNMTLSDFFSLVSNWFKSLDYDKVDKARNSSGSTLTQTLLMVNSVSSNLSSSTTATTSSTDSAYPMYDSDMIENIGHRSRVLLSVDDNIANVTEGSQIVNYTNVSNMTATKSAADGNVFNVTNLTTLIETGRGSNETTTKNDSGKQTKQTPKKKNKRKIKAIVKRNADDSNLIFWNDIYDDEYGIQTDKMDNYMKDKLDNSVRDKHSVKENDFIKRSGRWVQNKIRKFARNLKMNPHSDVVLNVPPLVVPGVPSDISGVKERVRRSSNHNLKSYVMGGLPQVPYNKIDYHTAGKKDDEKDEIEEEYPEIDQKSLFAALSLNMREVCKKAAKAVQQTKSSVGNCPDTQIKKPGVKDDGKQGSIASALMQQLVRLLTDLVDYQVQQKTCAKLPPDLESFLDWLINSKEEPEQEPEKQSDNLFKSSSQEDEELIDELQTKQEEKSLLPEELEDDKRERIADKSRYVDCLHSVQELMAQYDEMTADEKGKMLGVKSYLEKQMGFLNRQLSAYDLFQFLENHEIIRNKRAATKKQHTTRGKLRKFIKNFGKHTKTTTWYDEAQVTDILNKKTVMDEDRTVPLPNDDDKRLNKRNLKDVYYRAVAEAKKFSTAKNLHKKSSATHFETTTVRLK